MGMDRFMERELGQPRLIKQLQEELSQLRDKYDELEGRYSSLRSQHDSINEKLLEFQPEVTKLIDGAKTHMGTAWGLIDKMLPYLHMVESQDAEEQADIDQILEEVGEWKMKVGG